MIYLYAAAQRASGSVADIQAGNPGDNDVAAIVVPLACGIDLAVGCRVAVEPGGQDRQRQPVFIARVHVTSVELLGRWSSI